MNSLLPRGWVMVLLGEIVTARKGKKPGAVRSTPGNGFVPYLDIHAIEKGEISSYAEAASSRLATPEDVLVVWDGARSGWVGLGREGAIGSTIMALQPKVGDRNYLYRWLQSQFQQINTNTRGTGIPHVDPEIFWNLEVPLAPLAEQQRIVAKLERLLGKVDACQQRLARIPVLLKRFRQAVLAAACSGRLTADWRDENGLEPEWPRANLGDVAELVSGAGFPLDHQRQQGLPYPFFKVGNLGDVESGRELTTSEHSVDDEMARKLRARIIPKGAVVFAKIGMAIALNRRRQLGKAACIDNNMMAAIPNERIEPRYLLRFMETVDLMPLSQATTVPSLRKGDLEQIEVPLPSLAEQQEIVRRVEALFALADQIEARFQKAKAQVDKLTQSLLAKAFRGELVPQDPNDEPAEKLLERIRSERPRIARMTRMKEQKGNP